MTKPNEKIIDIKALRKLEVCIKHAKSLNNNPYISGTFSVLGEPSTIYGFPLIYNICDSMPFVQFSNLQFQKLAIKLLENSRKKDGVVEIMPLSKNKGIFIYVYTS